MPAAPIAALDLGTTKTCALIAEVTSAGALRVLGAGIAPSNGLRKGVVVDVKEASQSILAAVAQAEKVSGFKMEGVYVGIAGAHIESTNSSGVAAIHSGRGVTQEDIDRAMDAAEAVSVPHNREIIHAIPRGFKLDGQEGVTDPLGMIGFRLEVEAHVVTGAAASIQNLMKAVEAAGLRVVGLVLEPIAAGEAVLTDAEKEMGVLVVDIGGGTTDIAIFIDGSIFHTVVLPTGGMHITNDLAVGLRMPFASAEQIKIKYGHTDPELVPEDEMVEVDAFGEDGHRTVARREIAEIIRARVDEICSLILTEVKRSGYDKLLPAGVVLCGGTAQLDGMKGFAREVFQMPVRLGAPKDMEGYTDRLQSPAFATSVGLAEWGWKQCEQEERTTTVQTHDEHLKNTRLKDLIGWAKKAFLPG